MKIFSRKNEKIIKTLVIAAAFIALGRFGVATVGATAITREATNLGLVGYWSFNEGTSTTASDYSGNGNQGKLLNFSNPATATSGWTNAGKRGPALVFNGSTNYVTTSNAASLNGTSALTVAAWVKFSNIGSGSTLISKWGYLGNSDYSWLLFANYFSAGRVDFLVSGNGTTYGIVNSPAGYVTTGQWYYIVGVYSGTTLSLYINNVLVNTTSTGVPASIHVSATPVLIGADADQAGEAARRFLNGTLDETRIYNRALSQTEITALYQAGFTKINSSQDTRITNGLVGMWSFNGADMNWSGNQALDSSGYGNNGTLNGMFLATSPTIGKVGQALIFNGVNGFVNAGNASVFNMGTTNDVSVSAWVKTTATGQVWILDKKFAGTNDAGFDLWINQGEPIFRVANGSTQTEVVGIGTILVNDGKWHLVTGIATRATNTLYLYVDGVLDNAGAWTGTWNLTGSDVVTIGAYGGGSGGEIPGALDEVRLYNRSLSAAEVKQLYLADNTKINAPQNTRNENGLVGYWTFNGPDVTSTTARDVSGFGNTGTLVNSPKFTIGKVGQALSFNGINQEVTVPNSSSLNLTNAITLAAWVKLNSLASGGTNTDRSVIIEQSSSYYMTINSSVGTLDAYLQGTTPLGGHTSSISTISTNVWHYVAVTYDGTNVRWYIDGRLDRTLADSGTINQPGTAIQIGGESGFGRYINGSIDEARIYNRALSTAEILQLYNAGK